MNVFTKLKKEKKKDKEKRERESTILPCTWF